MQYADDGVLDLEKCKHAWKDHPAVGTVRRTSARTVQSLPNRVNISAETATSDMGEYGGRLGVIWDHSCERPIRDRVFLVPDGRNKTIGSSNNSAQDEISEGRFPSEHPDNPWAKPC